MTPDTQDDAPQAASEPIAQETPEQTAPEPPREIARHNEPIALDQHGLVRPDNQVELYRYCKMLTGTGLLPRHFDSPERTMLGYQTLTGMGLEFLSWARFTAFVHGTFMVWGDLPLALVKRSGRLKSIEEIWLDEDYEEKSRANKNLHKPVYVAICRMADVDGNIVERAWSVADAERTGKWGQKDKYGKPTVWGQYPDRMLQMRARSWAIKDMFPDVLQGAPQKEYDEDGAAEQRIANARVIGGGAASSLNDLFETEISKDQDVVK